MKKFLAIGCMSLITTFSFAQRQDPGIGGPGGDITITPPSTSTPDQAVSAYISGSGVEILCERVSPNGELHTAVVNFHGVTYTINYRPTIIIRNGRQVPAMQPESWERQSGGYYYSGTIGGSC